MSTLAIIGAVAMIVISILIIVVVSLQEGKGMPEPTETASNGKKDVGIYALEPTVVTKSNLEEVFANDAERMKLIEDNK